MPERRYGSLILILVWLLAAGAAQALASPAGPPQRPSREIQVTTETAPDGATVLNVVTKGVTLRKAFYLDHTELSIATPGHELKLVVSTTGIEASSNGGRGAFQRHGNSNSLDTVRAVLGASPVVPIGRALARAAAVGNPRAAETLKVSEALLGLLSGDPRALDSLVAARKSPGLVLAQTPNQCWETYRRDAMLMTAEYEDCVRRTRWYEVGTRMGCGVEYMIRAELAFSWLIACSGGFMGG